jgi:hypothetical protein
LYGTEIKVSIPPSVEQTMVCGESAGETGDGQTGRKPSQTPQSPAGNKRKLTEKAWDFLTARRGSHPIRPG